MGSPEKPWLEHEEWAKREIVCAGRASLIFVVLAHLIVDGAALIMIGWAIEPRLLVAFDPAPVWRLGAAAMGILVAILSVAVTLPWLRWRRYGDSVCRLITLPGVVGGWFKADVECRLPPNPMEPVVVRLRNLTRPGKGQHEVWRMQQSLLLPQTPDPRMRCVVPVRLRIPRHQDQQTAPLRESLFASPPVWQLEIRKKAFGLDFLAAFHVPVFDSAYDDPAEQRPD